jgi:hypothetical protein
MLFSQAQWFGWQYFSAKGRFVASLSQVASNHAMTRSHDPVSPPENFTNKPMIVSFRSAKVGKDSLLSLRESWER